MRRVSFIFLLNTLPSETENVRNNLEEMDFDASIITGPFDIIAIIRYSDQNVPPPDTHERLLKEMRNMRGVTRVMFTPTDSSAP